MADNRTSDAFAHGFSFRNQRLHDLEKLRLEIGVIHGQEKMLLAALAHEVADTLVMVTPAEATRLGMQVTMP